MVDCVLCGRNGANDRIVVQTTIGRRETLDVHRECVDWMEFEEHAEVARQRLLYLRYKNLRQRADGAWIRECPTLPGLYWFRFGSVPDEPPTVVEAESESGQLRCHPTGTPEALILPQDWNDGDAWQAVEPWA